MVNTKDKTEQERDFEQRQRAKEDRVLRAQGEGAARVYEEEVAPVFSQSPTTLGKVCEVAVAGILAACFFSLGISFIKNRQDGELRLVNPRDAYTLPQEKEPRTQAYFTPEHVADKLEGKALEDYKRSMESDDILVIANEEDARKQRVFYDASEEEKQNIRELKPGEFERYRAGYEKNAGKQPSKDHVSATVIFGIRAYRTVNGDTLSQIAERNATGWGSCRTMEEIIELNNAVVTGKGLEMLARRYGMPTEDLQEMVSQLPKAQMWKIDDPDYVQAGQVISIPKWGYVIRDKDKR
jgi:nucleoid-associated protein YgaU